MTLKIIILLKLAYTIFQDSRFQQKKNNSKSGNKTSFPITPIICFQSLPLQVSLENFFLWLFLYVFGEIRIDINLILSVVTFIWAMYG